MPPNLKFPVFLTFLSASKKLEFKKVILLLSNAIEGSGIEAFTIFFATLFVLSVSFMSPIISDFSM